MRLQQFDENPPDEHAVIALRGAPIGYIRWETPSVLAKSHMMASGHNRRVCRHSGVMTFMVNHDGVVFEKDLGPDTVDLVEEIDGFSPDDTWTKADVP